MDRRTAWRIGALLLASPLAACVTATRLDEASLAGEPQAGMAQPEPPPPAIATTTMAAAARTTASAALPPPPLPQAAPPPRRTNIEYRWRLCPESALRQGASSYLMLVVYPSRPPSDRKCAEGRKAEGKLLTHVVRDAVRARTDPADAPTPPEVTRYPDGTKVFSWLVTPTQAGGVSFKVSVNLLDAAPDGGLRPRTQPLAMLSDVEVKAAGAPAAPARAEVIPTPKIAADAPWWQNAWAILVYVAAGVAALATVLRNTEGVVAILRKWLPRAGGPPSSG